MSVMEEKEAPRSRRPFSKEFKADAVAMVLDEGSGGHEASGASTARSREVEGWQVHQLAGLCPVVAVVNSCQVRCLTDRVYCNRAATMTFE